MNKMKTSTKYIITTIVCLLLILAISIIMINRWLDYSTYHYPALTCAIVLGVIAVVFLIGYIIQKNKE